MNDGVGDIHTHDCHTTRVESQVRIGTQKEATYRHRNRLLGVRLAETSLEEDGGGKEEAEGPTAELLEARRSLYPTAGIQRVGRELICPPIDM